MNKKYILGLIISILIIGAGVTYAYFSSGILVNDTSSTLNIISGQMGINVDGGIAITADGIVPSNEPFITKTITLTGSNTTNDRMPYTIRIVVETNTFTNGAIKYSLEGENVSNSGNVISTQTLRPLDSSTYIGSGDFEQGNNLTHRYTLRVYFPETGRDQSVDMNKSFYAHIEASGKATKYPTGWYESQSGTLLAAIRDHSPVNTIETGMTTPGVDIAETDEGLRIEPDDYGTSFYFRGNVTNNYVLFAGKCWKIVRINGNGSIKLFLWNNANTCDSTSNAYDSKEFNPTSQKDTNNNTVYNYATGVGFMYGHSVPTGSTDLEKYLDAQSNITDSYILNRLKTWYTATFNTQALQDKLADTIWCGDKSLYSGRGYGQTQSYFGARERLYVKKKPSLICPNAGSDGKLSKYTASDTNKGNGALNGYKIGLLTADEVAFAGGVYDVENTSYYLRTGGHYWTLSPNHFQASGSYANVWLVYGSGAMYSRNVSDGYGVRPAVSLISAAQLTDPVGQDGTINHPYEIA